MAIEGIDLTSMRSMVEEFPKLLGRILPDETLQTKLHKIELDKISGVCMIGMGGSAIAGRLCASLLLESANKPLISVQDYHVPSFLDSNWIVIATSYSGNTEETLSAVQEAIQKGCMTFGITTGGRLSQLIDTQNIARVPEGFQPRAALPILFSMQLSMLEALLRKSSTDLTSIGKKIELASKEWDTHMISPAELAQSLRNKIPLFIGSHFTEGIAYRAKCQVNENAKSAAFFAVLPEANHNEIESIADFKSAKIQPIFIRSLTESSRVKLRIEATTSIYEEEMDSCIHLQVKADSAAEELLQLVFYLDLLSLEMAVLRNVDPVGVERISKLKKILSSN